MKNSIIALLFAAAALPLAAQATPAAEARQGSQEARLPLEGKAAANGRVTPRERARLAKEQNRQSRKVAKQKHEKQRKAPAS